MKIYINGRLATLISTCFLLILIPIPWGFSSSNNTNGTEGSIISLGPKQGINETSVLAIGPKQEENNVLAIGPKQEENDPSYMLAIGPKQEENNDLVGPDDPPDGCENCNGTNIAGVDSLVGPDDPPDIPLPAN